MKRQAKQNKRKKYPRQHEDHDSVFGVLCASLALSFPHVVTSAKTEPKATTR